MTRTETNQLRECPFCGSSSIDLTEAYGRKTASVFAECLDCGATGTPFRIGHDTEAVNAWNARAERTCEITVDDKTAINCTLFWCSYCETPSEVWFSYCPHCGAKVIGSSKYEQGASSSKVVE